MSTSHLVLVCVYVFSNYILHDDADSARIRWQVMRNVLDDVGMRQHTIEFNLELCTHTIWNQDSIQWLQ